MNKLYEKVLERPYEDTDKSIKPIFTGGAINENEPNKLYLFLQDGLIFKYDLSSKTLDPFANHSLKIKNIKSLPKNAQYADERGLLNMVFDERENSVDGYFIVYSRGFKEKEIELLGDKSKWFGKAMNVNDESNDNLMDHITVLSYIDKIGIETKLWEVLQPQFNHNGGGLVLDKLDPNILYWGLGDGGGRNDMHGDQMDNKIHVGYSQDPNVFYGKIWKINLKDGSLYHRDSLFDKPKSIKQIALGLRNPWRMNINPYNKNELVIADVGQDDWESIKIVPLNESNNEPHNMGWKILEGSHNFNLKVKDYFNVKLKDIIKPVLEYKRDGENTYAIIGGYFDPFSKRYIFGDYSGLIFISDWPPPSDMKPIIFTSALMKKGLLHSMAQDLFGNIYALMNNRKKNKNVLYKLNIPFGFKNNPHKLCSNIDVIFGRKIHNISWKSRIAIQRYKDITRTLGPADWVAPKPGGNAGWNGITLTNYGVIFNEIMIVDESIRHVEPVPHCDCMYISINVRIPISYLKELKYISKSMWYDQLKESLVARCHFVGASVATLRLALETINEKIKKKNRHISFYKENFPIYYKQYIKEASTPKGLTKQYDRLVKLLYDIRKRYSVTNWAEKICDYDTFEVKSLDELPSLQRFPILKDKFNINVNDNNDENLPSITNNLAGLFEFMDPSDLLNSDIKIIINQAKNAIKNTKSGTRVDSNGNPVNPVMQIVILPKGYPDKTLKKYKFYDVGARNDDNAWNISKDIAKAKAYTALGSSSNENASSSKSFHIPSEPGQSLYGIGNSNRNEKKGIITFAGGIPLYKKGKLIGAIGVSGDMVNIDEIIAKAAVKGFEAPEVIRADNVLKIEY